MKRDLETILRNTKEVNGCLEWTRCLNTDGYPRAVIDGNNNSKVHRVVWELFNNETASGYVIRHTCDNPKCINPKHLVIGTPQDNVKDRTDRNRVNSILKPNEVLAIRDLYSTKQYKQKELGTMFGVHVNTINSIVNFKHWKHVVRARG